MSDCEFRIADFAKAKTRTAQGYVTTNSSSLAALVSSCWSRRFEQLVRQAARRNQREFRIRTQDCGFCKSEDATISDSRRDISGALHSLLSRMLADLRRSSLYTLAVRSCGFYCIP